MSIAILIYTLISFNCTEYWRFWVTVSVPLPSVALVVGDWFIWQLPTLSETSIPEGDTLEAWEKTMQTYSNWTIYHHVNQWNNERLNWNTYKACESVEWRPVHGTRIIQWCVESRARLDSIDTVYCPFR